MNLIADKLINSTIECYNNTAAQYGNLRAEIKEIDKERWNILATCIKQNFSTIENLKILDIGACGGRDLLYGQQLGYDMYGIEISDGFLSILEQLFDNGKLNNKVKKCDMREIDYPDNFFDVVRHNATLSHIPVIGKSYTADKALEESYRILKKNGLLYVYVKEGRKEGKKKGELRIHDTNEGLGERIFQSFPVELLHEVIERNGFKILVTKKSQEVRPKDIIYRLLTVACKI